MSAKRPVQARGLERYNRILDACALLLASGGFSFSMRDLSEHASTSTGSLYHFFPDKQSVFNALLDRHHEALQCLIGHAEQLRDADWLTWDAFDAVGHLITPFLRYAAAHPDLIMLVNQNALHFSQARGRLRNRLMELYERVLRVRLPQADATAIKKCAYVLLQLPAGLINDQVEPSLHRSLLLEEAPYALAGYLTTIEQRYGGQRGSAAN